MVYPGDSREVLTSVRPDRFGEDLVADLLTGPDAQRVKRCGGCPWLFVDRSKNGSRRWCAMNDCGTHAKIRRYVARRAARRASS